MTIPKNESGRGPDTTYAGLSRPSDVANPVEHYPVRRRGTKRRLNPNWDAIRWLEDGQLDDTEISDAKVLGDGDWASMLGVRALGWYSAKRSGHYPRRMFDIFGLEVSSSSMIHYPSPCPDCHDFSRTWACAEHPEIKWDTARRCWVRPGTPIWYELHPDDRPEDFEPQPTAYHDTGARPPGAGELYDRMIEMFGRALPLPDEHRPVRVVSIDTDPNRGRPGYHYSLTRDRWVPDSGVVEGQRVSHRYIAADERLTAEWERQNGIPLADALRSLEFETPRGVLPDASQTLTGTFTLEITGDTTQASASSFRIEVRGSSDEVEGAERNDDPTP